MNSKYTWLSILLLVAAFGASIALYGRLPALVPSHWNINGTVDGYSPRALGAFLMPGTMAFLLILFWLMRWLSPRNFEVQRSGETYDYVMFCVIALMGYVHALMLWAALGHVQVDRALAGGLFVFFALIGNVMSRVKRNFWMGIKTPWTLASESVWDRAHRFGARCFVLTGVVGLILTVAGAPVALLFAVFLVGALIPVPYSLFVSRQEQGG